MIIRRFTILPWFLGARRVDIGQAPDVSWVVLADPEGNEFCVLTADAERCGVAQG